MAKREMPTDEPPKPKYPGNSYAKRDGATENTKKDISRDHEKPKQVAQAKVKKQGLIRKFTRFIVEDTIESAKEKTLMDIVKPGIKTLIYDTATEVLDLMLFGGDSISSRSSRRRSDDRRGGRTSYSRYYDEKDRRSDSRRSYRELANDPDDIYLDNRREAQRVLEELDYMIRKYGQASIADLYDIVGVTSEWTDNKYGWTSLRDAGIKPVREGYLLLLPRTRVLDD